MCGGTAARFPSARLPPGLSPRVRGNRCRLSRPTYPRRSIPACAGEPRRPGIIAFTEKVYPRVCGGTTPRPTTVYSDSGLSPRVRGNPARGSPDNAAARSIPACAGEPENLAMTQASKGVYPRVCGGTTRCDGRGADDEGLSPRVRGNRRRRRVAEAPKRSIPACAGEPGEYVDRRRGVGVYPRVCGGTIPGETASRIVNGLSPRVRGNPMLRMLYERAVRSIPACAGEPPCGPQGRPACGVYPRVCGGTGTGAPKGTGSKGLSPRVRGNHGRDRPPTRAGRSIPACAGEPK